MIWTGDSSYTTGDLVFFIPSDSVSNLEIIKTNTWSKIHDDYFKKVTSKFSFNLAW